MNAYVVVKNVRLQVNGREYFKDQIITVDDVGEKNIERYLKNGYVKRLNGNPSGGNDVETDFLTDDEINKMTKQQLIEYAGSIGMPVLKGSPSAESIRANIISYINSIGEVDETGTAS